MLGDTYYGESYHDKYRERNDPYLDLGGDEGYDTSFRNFGNMLNDSDLNIANLESAITHMTASPLSKLGKDYIHYSDVRKTSAALLRHHIHAVSLANNHSSDFGIEGLRQIQAILSRSGIHHFGAGEDRKEASTPYLFSFKLKNERLFRVAVIGAFQVRPKYASDYFDAYADRTRPGVFALDVERIRKTVEAIRKIDKDTFIILFPHWGRDYEKITLAQLGLENQLAPLGINAIIGHGAHTAQDIKRSSDRIVAFNIGNFMFNSNGRYKEMGSTSYSFIAKLIKPLDSDQIKFRFYPIFGDNKWVHYSPRFVGPAEFDDVLDYVKIRNNPDTILDLDEHGYFIEYQIADHILPREL